METHNGAAGKHNNHNKKQRDTVVKTTIQQLERTLLLPPLCRMVHGAAAFPLMYDVSPHVTRNSTEFIG